MSQVPERFASLPPLKRAVLALQEVQAKLDAVERARTEPIAIIGMGCRIPGGIVDPEGFWQLLRDGISAVREVPADRWDVEGLYDPDPDAPGKICAKHGGYLDTVDAFDAPFFGIAPREAQAMDPQQRLLLEVSWEALEHAGVAADRLSGSRTGVFIGIAGHDYAEVLRDSDLSRIDAYHASGIAHSVASGRLSYVLGLQGPCVSVDTACSSSLMAVHLAVQSLRAGECRMALTGGVNLILTPTNGIVFSKSHMLAGDGRCKTFDAAADGFGRGEGCGVIVLKRLSDALADGDRICAVIRGSAANQDGPSSGLTAPNGPAQVSVIRDALANGAVAPAHVNFVEAHGTGTSLGDPIEVQALGAAYGEGRAADRPLLVASLKTNVGHMEAAAGIGGLIKVVLSLQHEALPAHLNLERLNPLVAWEDLPLSIPTALTPWPRAAEPRFAGVSSFGFSGTNVHIVLEEAPVEAERKASIRPAHLVTVSARSASALRTRVGKVLGVLRGLSPAARAADVAHTANAGRAHLPVRVAVQGGSVAELADALSAWHRDQTTERARSADLTGVARPKPVFLFTGQGAQYPGMGRGLYETQPVFRQALDRSDAVLRSALERPLLEVLYGDAGDLLDQTAYTQPALFAVEYALAEMWKSWGIEPAAVLGHSIGEYVAACVAGVFTPEDALTLVAERGRLMQALPRDGMMAAVFADEARVLAHVGRRAAEVSIAAVNGPSSVVISGGLAAIQAVLAELAAEGVRSKPLNVSHAFHSPLMEPMLDEFEAAASKLQLKGPRLKVISNLTGKVATAAEMTSPRYWREHLRGTVRFADGIRTLSGSGSRLFLEAGPQPTLIGLAAQSAPSSDIAWVGSLRQGRDDWQQILDALASLYVRNAPIDWEAVDRGEDVRAITLPTYPFERERCWVERAPRPAIAADGAAGGHPLVGRKITSPAFAGTILEGRLSKATHAYLYDHRVHGTPILPATGFLEIALAAARAAGSPARVGDVSIREAMVLPEDGVLTVQVVTEPVADRGAAFRIYSGLASAGGWTLHAEGTTLAPPPPSTDVADRAAALRDSGAVRSKAEFYEGLEARGLAFGAAFQGVEQVWIGAQAALGVAELPAAVASDSRFDVHPVLLDAAVQVLAGALMESDGTNGSFLPVHLEAFELAETPGRRVAAYASMTSKSADVIVADVILLDHSDYSRVLGRLSGLTLKRARSGSLRRAGATDDWLYGVGWEPAGTAVPVTVEPLLDCRELVPAIDAAASRAGFCAGFNEYEEWLPALDEISAGFIAEAFRAVGVPTGAGARFSADDVFRGGALETFRPLVARLIEILVERGVVRAEGGGFVVAREVDGNGATAWMDRLLASGASCGAELALLERCGPALAQVLLGTVSPLALLFPDGSSAAAERLYQQSPPARFYNGLVQAALAAAVERLPADRPLRVLEIGGGTASTTGFAMQVLPKDRVEYTFSDISPLFVARAEERFAGVASFRGLPLDIERDPIGQGFTAHGYDLVIAANVLHATADLAVTFGHVHRLLAPGGLMVLLEVTRKLAWIDVTFGLTDGWWLFTDRALRADYPLLGRAEWTRFLSGAGFDAVTVVPAAEHSGGPLSMQSVILATAAPAVPAADGGGRWLIAGDTGELADAVAAGLRGRGADCRVVGTAELRPELEAAQRHGRLDGVLCLAPLEQADSVDPIDRQRAATGLLLDIVRALGAASADAKLVVATRGGQHVAAADLVDPDTAALWGMARTVAREHPEWRTTRIDLDPLADVEEQTRGLLSELGATAADEEVAYRNGARFVSRLDRVRSAPSAARGIEHLRSAMPGVLESLEYSASEHRAPARGEVEIEVRAASLNFRDVVNALGIRNDSDRFGGECAGTIVALGPGVEGYSIGDEVIGLAPGSMGTRTVANAHLVVPKPEALSFEDAAGIPIVFVTADYALNEVGKVGPGDRVLVHAAAGGVGLAAIQLARRAGAEVLATAGTDAKRQYLRSLGVEHVFDSRSLSFAAGVMGATAGRGVTVVLNSLAGEFIPESIGVLDQGGRFLEIGKNNIWSRERVQALRPDVKYYPIDLTSDMEHAPHTVAPALRRLVADVASGELGRLPRRVFPAERAVDAFRFMAKGHHIGKVIVSQERGGRAQAFSGTCLITGGLSGLGLATASRLAERGCRSFMLMGRSAPEATAIETIGELRSRGVSVAVQQGDVSSLADVQRALAIIDEGMAPLSGIVHSAGVLDDGVLVQQDWSRFATVYGPKIAGAWHLHKLTEHRPLDFFVMFSSVAAIVGPSGQANHAAANAFLDALAHRRRAAGLPALSVNWGAWSGIGAAVRHGVKERVSGDGVGVIPPADGLDVLESLMTAGTVQAAVLPVDWRLFGRSAGAHVPQLFSKLARPGGTDRKAAPVVKPADDFAATVRQTPAARRHKVVSAHVRQLASRVLGGGRASQVDARVALNEIGLDSLMAVELRNVLGASIGRTLPATLLFDYPTIDALTACLLDLLVGPEPGAAPVAATGQTGAANVLDKIDELSDDEIDRLLAARMASAK